MGTKISEFAAATTPLTGAELVPVVQGGSTLKTTAGAFSTLAPVQSVAGRTGAVVIASTDVTGFTAAAAAAAPVQSVAGRTGAVTLGISDVASLQTSLDGKLSTSGGVISANSSTDALRITQVGTGNALVVEDSANPDVTPFVVTNDGSVAIGTLNLSLGVNSGSFAVFRDAASGKTLSLSTFGSEEIPTYIAGRTWGAVDGPYLQLAKAGGTKASPIAVSNGQNLGLITFVGQVSSSLATDGAIIAAETAGTVTSTSLPTCLKISTTPSGSLIPVERMRIDASGNVGIGTASPSTYGKFAVVGADEASLLGLGSASGVLRAKSYSAVFSGALIEGTNAAQSGYANMVVNGLNTIIATGGSEKMRVDSSGNIGIRTTSFGTSAIGVIGIANGTAPSSSPAGMGQLYVESGALKYRGSSGTITTIANA